jgi:cysteinyl-tRNA synthetase
MYTCGPTVYDYPHIGHGRKYIMDDILRRVLEQIEGYEVNHVQNVTDVGHLVSDADEGEDKLEKGAKKSGKSVWDVARFFESEFQKDMDTLNILKPTTVCRATDHIPEQIALVQKLVAKGYAYDTPEAVYFDVYTFHDYTKLFGQKLEEKLVKSRDEVREGNYKKHPADFAVWFKRIGRFENHTMHWDSPWGDGFPGWHIECSAMSIKYLGETIDIHTGGIDHLATHHPNEIAQSEAATGKQFVKFWIHHAFLMIDGAKMSKSKDNFYRISDVENKGFSPMDLRYFYLTAHYRKTLNFTWGALEGSRYARQKLINEITVLENQLKTEKRTALSNEKLQKVNAFSSQIKAHLCDDLKIPQALATFWDALKSNIPSADKLDLIYDFDTIFGLRLREDTGKQFQKISDIPDSVKLLVSEREKLRAEKRWDESDVIRLKIESLGYLIEDTKTGSNLILNSKKSLK